MIDLNEIKAGEYELTAVLWDQVTSKPGQPFDFTRHRRGDKVSLSVEEARRLVSAGAVKVPGEKPEAPGSGPSVAPGTAEDQTSPVIPTPVGADAPLDISANADAVLEWVGEDKARADEALAAEQAKDTPRTTLVPKLEALANPQA